MIRSYYFFDAEKLSANKRTKQQLTIEGTKSDAEPVTEISKAEENYFGKLSRLQLIHEMKDKTPRRLVGNMDYIDTSIVGGRTPFNLYYDKDAGILIARCPKHIINSALRRLKSDFPDLYKVKKHIVDFAGIIEKTHSTVLGAWFGLEGIVKRVGLFGDRVNLDETFDKYQRVGSMTSLYIEMEFEGKKTSTVLLTKDGGVILFDEWELEQDLMFLTKIVKPLFYNIEAKQELA